MLFKFDPNKVGRSFKTDDDVQQEMKVISKKIKAVKKNRNTKKGNRENRINLRLNDDEYEMLIKKSNGMSLAKFLREWVLSGEMPVKKERKTELPKIDPELMRKITSMTNNLNQLTRYAHMEKNEGNPIDILALAFNIESMQRELRELREFYTIGDIK